MKYLSFDLRALGLMRICISLVIILDLCIRGTDLEAFYSNTGVVPLTMLFQHAWNDYYISIHTLSGLWQVQLLLFIMAGLFAFMMLIGYRTRLFTCLSWFMLLSLHNRNGLILQGGDDLLRTVLFWCIFIPWGSRYSCDHLLDREQTNTSSITTVATIAYLLQICYLYSGSALLKGPEWNQNFNALYYTYSLDQITYPITKYIYYYPELLKKITFIAYYFELFVPVLFFIPFRHDWFRFAGVALIVLFHMGNLLTLFIGLFPIIGIMTSLGMLPSFAMDKLEIMFGRLKKYGVSLFLKLSHVIGFLIPWRKALQKPVFIQHIQTALLIFLVLFVFDWNYSNLSFTKSKMPEYLRFIGYSLRIDQSWGMFAPGVFKEDGWYVLEGVTEDDEHIDLLNPGEKLNLKKPESVVSMFKNDRWRKYSENYIFRDNLYMRGYYCCYQKRKWNESHPEKQIKSLQVIYMEEMTLPDYQCSVPQKNILWEYSE